MAAGRRPAHPVLLKRAPHQADTPRVREARSRRVAWSDQGGFGLIEVLVTAMVILLVATATVSAIGSSQNTSSRTLGRGVVASLGEQDQERMRAMRASDLAGYSATETVVRENVSYRIDSNAEFVQEAGTTSVNCLSTGNQAQFLRLNTDVTPLATQTRMDPLHLESLYALPIQQYSPSSGTLIVQIFKADGTTGQPSIPVSISGPESRTASTNAQGCAIFQFLTTGSYNVNVNSTGYVDTTNSQNVSFSGTVSAGNINQTPPLLYDRAGRIDYVFDTDGVLTPLTSKGVTIANSGLPSPGSKTLTGTASATGLFPFTGPYTAYSGTCAYNDPSRYDPNYFTTSHPTYGRQIVAAGTTYSGVRLREPDINTKVQLKTDTSTTTPAGITTYVRQTDTGCSYTYPATTTKSGGALTLLGYPFGTYAVCSEYNRTTGTTTQKGMYYGMKTGIANTDFAGTPATGTHTYTIDTTKTTTTVSGTVTTGKNTCANVLP